MFKFFNTIINLISTIGTYIADAVESLINLIGAIVKGMGYAFELVNKLPDFVIVFMIALVGFSIVTFIINKGD